MQKGCYPLLQLHFIAGNNLFICICCNVVYHIAKSDIGLTSLLAIGLPTVSFSYAYLFQVCNRRYYHTNVISNSMMTYISLLLEILFICTNKVYCCCPNNAWLIISQIFLPTIIFAWLEMALTLPVIFISLYFPDFMTDADQMLCLSYHTHLWTNIKSQLNVITW